MQDKSTYLLASDSEGEMEDWINTLNKILHSSFEIAMQEKRNGDIHDGVCTWRSTNMKGNIILCPLKIFAKFLRSLCFSKSCKNIQDLIMKCFLQTEMSDKSNFHIDTLAKIYEK